MKALVTGGGGFLGTRIAQLLHERGDEVRVFGRGHYPWHEKIGIECVDGDVRDAETLTRACRGVDVVFHAAALTGVWGKRRDFFETNVEGTNHVIEACRRCGVGRLVYTSSPSVVFGTESLCGVDESQPYPVRYLAAYPETKAIAERTALAANSPDLATVALRPHLIWGPGDRHLIPRVIERARAGRLVQVGDGKNLVDITYIDNAAEAHLAAAAALSPDARCAGRAYFISQGDPVVLWTWLGELLHALGLPPVEKTVSFRKAYRFGAAAELAYRLLRVAREPPMTRFVAAQLAKSHYFNISAARNDLRYVAHVSSADGFRRLVDSLRDATTAGARGRSGSRSRSIPAGSTG